MNRTQYTLVDELVSSGHMTKIIFTSAFPPMIYGIGSYTKYLVDSLYEKSCYCWITTFDPYTCEFPIMIWEIHNIRMKKTASLLAITMITAMIMWTVPSVQAITYSSYATDLTGCWKVWLTVDTTARTLEVKWAEPFLGLSYWPFGSYIHVWDDDGHIYWVWCSSTLSHNW